jgi:DNA-binding CsgD family transcriptional regulator
MLPSAYMTDAQMMIWGMRRQGISQAEIGRRINISRQAVNDALKIAHEKVGSALRHAAEANMIEVRHVDPEKGILLGFSPSHGERVIITFSIRHGIQTWHYGNPKCVECSWVERCRRRLLEEAEERNILLDEEEKLPPSRLAHIIFSRVIPGLEP